MAPEDLVRLRPCPARSLQHEQSAVESYNLHIIAEELPRLLIKESEVGQQRKLAVEGYAVKQATQAWLSRVDLLLCAELNNIGIISRLMLVR